MRSRGNLQRLVAEPGSDLALSHMIAYFGARVPPYVQGLIPTIYTVAFSVSSAANMQVELYLSGKQNSIQEEHWKNSLVIGKYSEEL